MPILPSRDINIIYKDYTSSYEMLREKCNRPMLLIERQKAILLEVYNVYMN